MPGFLDLHLAVKEGDLCEVERLLSQRYDIGKVNPKTGINSLHLAVLTGNYDIVELLLSRGEKHIDSTCSLQGADCEGYTPLHFSVDLCYKNITELLLSREADVNDQNEDGNTALHVAAYCGIISNQTKRVLLNRGKGYSKNDNCLDNVHGIKTKATMKAYCDIIKILLASGANARRVNKNRETALHVACQHGNDTVAQMIVKKCKRIVNYEDRNGRTALHIVVNSYNSDLETANLLIECGADIDAIDSSGNTPLYNACLKKNVDIVRILVENGCDVNIGGDDIPINIAIRLRELKILKLLLKRGADISQVDLFSGFNLPSSEKIDRETFLLEISCKDFFKTTVKLFGCQDFYFEVFKLLLQHGCFKNTDRINLYFNHRPTCFVGYIIKMKTLGCFFAMDYPDCASNIHLLPYEKDCKIEVEMLKGIFVYSDISLLDFLQKDLNFMVRLLKNQEIVNLLEHSNYEMLPIYGDLIKALFKLLMQRRSMLNRCYECFNAIFCQFPQLPDTVVEYIFDFFTNKDLRILLTTCY